MIWLAKGAVARAAVDARARVSIAGSASVGAWASCSGGSFLVFAIWTGGGGLAMGGGLTGGIGWGVGAGAGRAGGWWAAGAGTRGCVIGDGVKCSNGGGCCARASCLCVGGACARIVGAVCRFAVANSVCGSRIRWWRETGGTYGFMRPALMRSLRFCSCSSTTPVGNVFRMMYGPVQFGESLRFLPRKFRSSSQTIWPLT